MSVPTLDRQGWIRYGIEIELWPREPSDCKAATAKLEDAYTSIRRTGFQPVHGLKTRATAC